MHRALASIALLGLLCMPGSAGAQMAEVFKRTSESLLKIEAGNNAASGFIWSDSAHAVTALHVVDGQQRIVAHYVGADGKIVASTTAVVEKVLKESDLVLLRLQTPQNRKPLALNLAPPAVKQSFDALGFPLNIAGYSSTEVKLRFGGNQLRTILPPKVLREITDYPSTSIEILNLEGNLVPGLSGAPIMDAEGRVIGIVDGGLENGAVGISWGIPASHLQLLAQSNVSKLPGSTRNAALFAADLQADVAPTQALGAFGLTKLRSRTYQQLAATADDQLGLAQLTQMFQMFNPNAFRYDIYQDLVSGATVVVPEGAQLAQQGNFIVVRTDDARMSMKIQLKSVSNPQQAIAQAQVFEQQLLEPGNGVAVLPDPAWTYLQAMQRFGVTTIRKAWNRAVYRNGMLQTDRYYFETLATNGKSLLGVAAANNDSSYATNQMEVACMQGLADARCAALVRSRETWARMVLGVQFSSFPVQQF
ncbi:Trypsin-like peptidase domain-containing protein [Rhodoferax sp. OV413]|uniref:S1 family peptidase n=1 Tax=Rhodoferax sp. OV413 TaxID=1855285 RepID=UPI00088B4FFA|nr:serine protease [Rhodoferax sp. OV413]SDP81114.1 Trypsin-like peptidase domain-containing protein [Rhodoferax sp. OV413]